MGIALSIEPFKGTFDGNGKTLTFNYTAKENYTAPFRFIDGTITSHASIRNLNVVSNITSTSYKHIAGLISLQRGYVDVTNCNVTVNISSTTTASDKSLYPAGLVSQVASENGSTLTVNLYGNR